MNMSVSSTPNEDHSTNLEAPPPGHQMPPSSPFITSPIGTTTTGNTQPGGSINSIMNFIYPNYQPSHISTSINTMGVTSAPQNSMNLGPVEDTNNSSTTSSMSVAAAISGASATLAQSQDEPKMKKVKLNHFNFFKNQLFADSYKQQQSNMMHGSGSNTNSQDLQAFYMNHKKLEERIGGILCCTVCLDLPSTAIYQVSFQAYYNLTTQEDTVFNKFESK